ncbi:MAG: thioredoxin family protein [Candidatus Micrarchaeota archaeon]
MRVELLDFTGKWCSTCIVLDRLIESGFLPRYKNKMKFTKIDVDENERLTEQYGILSVPTVVLLKDGKEVWRKSGSITPGDLKSALDSFTSASV